jgi:nucleotide-binding universal stress UspA family protein
MKTLNIKNILVPVDFSEMSFEAIDAAKNFAARFHATVHLLHVHEFYYPAACFGAAPLGLPAAVPDWSYTIAQQMEASLLQKLRDIAVQSGLSADHCYVERGAPVFDEICQFVRTIGADLIVAGTHGRGTFQHVLLGSTAERLVQHSPCPVVVTRPKTLAGAGRNGERHRIHRILVPVDFSDQARVGLDYAIELARKVDAEITVLHVIDFGSALTADGYVMYDLSRYQEIACEEAQLEMRRFLKSVNFEGVRFFSKVVADLFIDGINSTINKDRIDLLVTTTHGRTGFKHVLIGSIAERMARRADCPVLVVPSHPKDRVRSLGIVAKRKKLTRSRRGIALKPSPRPRPHNRLTRRFRKLIQHPFPERRKTNRFREQHG